MSDTPLRDAAVAYYEETGWPAEPLDEDGGFAIRIGGTDGEWTAMVLADDVEHRFVFYSLAPVDVPEERRAAVGEFLHRANHGLVTGTFEMDADSGEVRLRTGIELFDLPGDLAQDPRLLRFVVSELSAANVATFDRYLTGLLAVVMSDVPPRQVVEEIEATG